MLLGVVLTLKISKKKKMKMLLGSILIWASIIINTFSEFYRTTLAI